MLRTLRSPLAIATFVGLLCGLSMVTFPIDHLFWNVRFKLMSRDVPQSIVVIAEESPAPQSRAAFNAEQARLIEVVRRQMPQRVFLDFPLEPSPDATIDSSLAAAIRSLGSDVAVVVRPEHEDADRLRLPSPRLAGTADVVSGAWRTDFLGYAVFSRRDIRIDDRAVDAFAVRLARLGKGTGTTIYHASEYDPTSIPSVDAARVLAGAVTPGTLTGRTVVISQMREGTDRIGYLGHGQVDPVMVDIAASYGLRKPGAAYLGTVWPVLLIAGLIGLGLRPRRRSRRVFVYTAATALTIASPVLLQLFGIYIMPSAALVTIAAFGGIRLWQHWRSRLRHTSASGLPNLLALAEGKIDPTRDVVMALIARYEEFLATLPADLHGECAQQIARRLAVGCGTTEIYHGEGGQFAWTEEARPLDVQFDHFEGLRALFSAPLQIGAHRFDTNIHFGLDRNNGLDATTRVNTALASATEAMKNGRTAECFEADRLVNAAWDLSLNARIDEGLRNGEIWLAFQPQWDFLSGRFSGAEALIRWNHPERGPIRPDAFILHAERAGRIDTLTWWVVEQAITAHAALAAVDPEFGLSINLSGQMVDKPSLIPTMAEIVRRRGIDSRLLTIEVTETSSVRNRAEARSNLAQLRAMGFRLSIDDFGTGEASLSYLAELPSDELKLDRRFVSAITGCDRNRAIVANTIRLAHDLGQSVVAEGIEDAPTFELLHHLGCDQGQGYYIAKPAPLPDVLALCSRMDHSGLIRFRDC